MSYLCQYNNGVYFVKYSIKDMSTYIGTSTMLCDGDQSYSVIQVL